MDSELQLLKLEVEKLKHEIALLKTVSLKYDEFNGKLDSILSCVSSLNARQVKK